MRLTWKIRSKLGLLKENKEYYVYLLDIKVPKEYAESRIGQKKWDHKLDYWRETGEFESKIILDMNFNLLDGYSSYKIALSNDIIKVPVEFVDISKVEKR